MKQNLPSVHISCELCSSLTFHAYSGAALLVEAANMGDPEAQYELGCQLRVEVFTLHLLLASFCSTYLILFFVGHFINRILVVCWANDSFIP